MRTIIVILAFELLAFIPASAQETVTDFDGNVYHVVKIGTQKWLQENIKALHYSDGAPIPGVAAYNDSDSLANLYGRLYPWDAAMRDSTSPGAQGVCPAGWHVPSVAEWAVLENFLGGAAVAGGKMKDTVTGFWDAPNTGATNSSGFSGLPGGEYDGYYTPHVYQQMHQSAVFWTSTQVNGTLATQRYLDCNSAACLPYDWYKVMKYSIRGVKSMNYLQPQVTPGTQSVLPGQAAAYALVLPSVLGYHGTVGFTASVTPAPATGAVACAFDPATVNPADSSVLTVTVSADAAPGRYVISIAAADSADTLADAATVELNVLGSGQALCVGCPAPLIDLVRLLIPQTDNVNRLPTQVGTNYRYLVMADSGRPSDTAAVRAFIQQGGNVLLTGRAPADLAGGNALAGIAGWLGAQTNGTYTGAGIKVISTYANPFGVSAIAVGDTFGTAVNGYSVLSSLVAGAVKLAKYGTSSALMGGLYNAYGGGRCLWLAGGAGFSAKQDQLIQGFLVHPMLGVSGSEPGMAPRCTELYLAVFPNPSAGRLGIDYQLPATSRVVVRLYDVCGRLVRACDQGLQAAGSHRYVDALGNLAAGVYIVKVETNGATAARKAIVLR